MRRILPTLLVGALLIAASTAAADDECVTEENATELDVGDRKFYFVNDNCQPVIGTGDCLFSIWVFEESNGQPGLQRGGELGEHCNGDTIIL